MSLVINVFVVNLFRNKHFSKEIYGKNKNPLFVTGSTYHDQIVSFRFDHFDRFIQIGTKASGTFGKLKTLGLMR